MTSMRTLLLSLLLAVLAVGVLAPAAVAEDPSPLDRLTPEERQVLESRVPGWEKMTEEQRAKIAKNVLRLRKLSPEERERFMHRLRALEDHRKRHGRIPEGFRHWRKGPDRRKEFKQRGLIVHAVGVTMWADLPKPKRAAVKEHLGSRGRSLVEHAFFHRLWLLHAKRIAEGDLPTTDELAEHAPPHRKKHVEGLIAQAAAGDEKAKLRLAHFSLAHRTRVIGERLRRVKASDQPALQEALKTVGALIRDEAPDLYRKALEEVTASLESKKALEDYVRRGPFGRRALAPELDALRRALDDAWPLLEKDRRLLEAAQKLRQALDRAGPGRMGHGKRGPGLRGPARGGERGPRRGGGMRRSGEGRPPRESPSEPPVPPEEGPPPPPPER